MIFQGKCCGNCMWYSDGLTMECKAPLPDAIVMYEWAHMPEHYGFDCPCHTPQIKVVTNSETPNSEKDKQ